MDWFAQTLTALLTALVLAALLKAERRSPDLAGGSAVLEYSRGVRWFLRGAAIAFALLLTWALVAAFLPGGTARDVGLVAAGFLVLGPLAIFGFFEPRVRLAITASGIGGRTAFRGRREVAWSDVTRIRYSAVSANWTIEGRGEKVRVSRYLVGSASLVTAFETKLPPEIWRAAVDAWRKHPG
ncbi:MAG: PH domain-containing protein [Planctomycetes bacterium]|nr:PH domain-containing protein [Planctomycetota bacterium]